MIMSRQRPKAALVASFGLGILAFAMTPKAVGYQELAALVARPQVTTERSQKRGFSSPFGTIHAANFNMPQPISSAIPGPLGYVLAGLDSGNAEITGSIRDRMLGEVMADMARYHYIYRLPNVVSCTIADLPGAIDQIMKTARIEVAAKT